MTLEWTETKPGRWVADAPIECEVLQEQGVDEQWFLFVSTTADTVRVEHEESYASPEDAKQAAERLLPQVLAAASAVRYVALRQAVERGERPRADLAAADHARETAQAEALFRLATSAAESMRGRCAEHVAARAEAFGRKLERAVTKGSPWIDEIREQRDELMLIAAELRSQPLEPAP
jgi:hypothetical protein